MKFKLISSYITLITAIIFLFIWLSPGLAKTPDPTQSEDVRHLAEVESHILTMINEIRKNRGHNNIEMEQGLRDIAGNHSLDMLERGFYAHVTPDGLKPQDRVAIHHRTMIGLISENCNTIKGLSSFKDEQLADIFVKSWEDSPLHLENILRPNITHTGIGAVTKGDHIMVTQKFAQVIAYTDKPVPDKIVQGEKLALDARPFSDSFKKPTKFDLYTPDNGKRIAGPFEISGAEVDAPPGIYTIRYFFPQDAGGFMLYRGQQIEVIKGD